MSVKEAARLLNVSRPHIYTLEKRGQLRIIRNPAYRTGPVTIPLEDIQKILARRHADPPT